MDCVMDTPAGTGLVFATLASASWHRLMIFAMVTGKILRHTGHVALGFAMMPSMQERLNL
jgi:hypothetical protein